MTCTDIPICEPAAFPWDLDEVRDLIHTTPLVFGGDGLPAGYQAEQLFGLEAASLTGRSF